MISPINQFIEFAQEGGARRRSQRQRKGGKSPKKSAKKGRGKKARKGTRKKSRSRKH